MNHYSLRCATTYLSCYAVTAVTLPDGLSYFAFDTLIIFVLIINDYCLLFFLMKFVTPGCSGDTRSRHITCMVMTQWTVDVSPMSPSCCVYVAPV